MQDTIFKSMLALVSAGIIASPLFVVDRISAQEKFDQNTYATKERVVDMSATIFDIREQQKKDHDILIRIAERLNIRKEG